MTNIYGPKATYIAQPTDEQIKQARAVVVTVGSIDSEGWDSPFELPDSMVQAVLNYASLNPNVVAVVYTGGGRNISLFNNKVPAIIYAWYPGQNGNQALAEIMAGITNPSGKLPITIEKEFSQSPGFGYMVPGDTFYNDWGPDFDMNIPVNNITYSEGVMVGYRWYQHKNIEPLYWFGHGLSYTKFEYSGLKVRQSGSEANVLVEVTFNLKNTGKVAGAEVAQIYVSDPDCSVVRPNMELKGFVKEVLQPGESKQVRVVLSAPDFSYFDAEAKSWKLEPGTFTLKVGSAVNQVKLSHDIVLK
jgi:beta-glucosidase